MSDYTKLPRGIADCMKRAGAELSEDQYMLLAGYLAQTQSELTAAKAEIEQLRGRVAELESEVEFIGGIGSKLTKAATLRKQAEAVEQVSSDIGEMPFLAKSQGELNGFNMSAQVCAEYAQRLRAQADELESKS